MFNLAFVGILLSTLPELLSAVAETVQAVEASGSDKPGPEKKKEATEAVVAWYKTTDKIGNFPESVDSVFEEQLAPALVEFVFNGLKFTPPGAGLDIGVAAEAE